MHTPMTQPHNLPPGAQHLFTIQLQAAFMTCILPRVQLVYDPARTLVQDH